MKKTVTKYASFIVAIIMLWALISAILDIGDREPYQRLARSLKRSDSKSLVQLAGGDDGVAYLASLAIARNPRTDPRHRIVYLKRAINIYPGPGLKQELATAMEAAGLKAAAMEEWSRFLPSPGAVEAIKRVAPDAITGAERLNSGSAFRAALEWLDQSAGTGLMVNLQRSKSLTGLGRHEEALAGYEQYLSVFPDDRPALLGYAQSLEALGRRQTALDAYLKSGGPGSGRAGRILEKMGRPEEAAAAYLKSDNPEDRWNAALIYETSGRTEQALQIYRQLAVLDHAVHDDAALRMRRIANSNPTSSSGISFEPAKAAEAIGEHNVYPRITRITRAEDLWSKGLAEILPGRSGTDLAILEMEIAVQGAQPDEKVAIAEWFASKGKMIRAMSIAASLIAAGSGGQPKDSISADRVGRLAYPLIFDELIRSIAGEFGLEPALVMAVIREESWFNPEAVSFSNARGLMQIMPSTGQWVGSKQGLTVTADDLFKPELNVRLGAWYLRFLIDRWDGNINKAIASYNAGEGNVARWIKHPLYKDEIDLPAVLAYPETREYLAKVTDTRRAYQRYYGDDLRPAKGRPE